MSNVQHTGTISRADADQQTEAVKKIMAEQGLNYGPAYDVYIKRQRDVTAKWVAQQELLALRND